jgi:ABC-type uncharacterized transport system involved in gliding motility auxiliary subunit
MNKSFSKIKHIQETNSRIEKRIIKEGFVQEFKEAQNGQGTVSFDPELNHIVFQVGPRKFFVTGL